MDFVTLCSPNARVSLDLRVGHLRDYSVFHNDRWHSPLHSAAWIDDEDTMFPDDLPEVERYLSGDFLCAPFAQSDVEAAPFHGWSANSRWDCVDETSRSEARFRLRKTVMGARVEKQLRCANDAPLLYQTHRFIGGSGALPVAHHVLTRMEAGGRISHSPKCLATTPDAATEPGLNHLICPATSVDPTAFPSRSGTTDLTRFPIADVHEDFVVLIDAPDTRLGWTAVLRDAEDDIVFVLKDPKVLPVTMHWYSNGGLTTPPWNGRHRNVLGIEDGCSGLHCGHRASLAPSELTRIGVPTALALDPAGSVAIRHVIGAVQRPVGWDRVAHIELNGDVLRLEGSSGETLGIRFDGSFFEGPE